MGISLAQFKQLTDRVSGRRARPVAEPSAPGLSRRERPRVVLGLDPSLRGTGYGVIRFGAAQPVAVVHGTITCPASWPPSRCLARILQTVRDVLEQHHPEVCAVEGLFFAQNLRTAIVMGEARGAALAVIAEHGLDIYELAPRKVKQAIVGYGAAQKQAVSKMVQRMLQLPAPPAPDAADALALALAFAHELGRHQLAPPRKI